jgi:hypothetical protein
MNEKIKHQYVAALIDGKDAAKSLEAHELRTLEKLKATGNEIDHLERTLMSLRAEMEKVEVAIVTGRGKASALADLLWAEHLALRGAKEPAPEAPPTA